MKFQIYSKNMEEALEFYASYYSSVTSAIILPTILEFNIPEKLSDGPKSIPELIEGTEINPDRLHRFLLQLEANEIFSFDSDSQKWTHSKKSSFFLNSIFKKMWLWHFSPYLLENLFHSSAVLTSTKNSFEVKGKNSFFEDLSHHPKELLVFQNCMKAASLVNVNEVVEKMDVKGINKLMDIGGGDGSLIIEIVKANNHLKGAVFDRPEVAEIANKNIENQGLSERVSAIGGSILESIAEGFEAICMKHIIHDWPDEQSLIILKNCRKVLSAGQKLFIIDALPDRNNRNFKGHTSVDVRILHMHSSKERSLDDFKRLLEDAGFVVDKIIPITFEHIIECSAV